jgi:hypothetical protein
MTAWTSRTQRNGSTHALRLEYLNMGMGKFSKAEMRPLKDDRFQRWLHSVFDAQFLSIVSYPYPHPGPSERQAREMRIQ